MGRKNKKSKKTSNLNQNQKIEIENPEETSEINELRNHKEQVNEIKQLNKNTILNDNKIISRSLQNNSKQDNEVEILTESPISNESLTEILSDLKLIINTEKNKTEREIDATNVRDCFINSLCQECKNFVDEKEECKKCKMIAYCSTEHRRRHWPVHADLCEAIQEVCKTMNKKHILENLTDNNNAEKFKQNCYNLMLECQKRTQRQLEEWEVELFLYPNVCETCFNYNKEELVNCKDCRHRSFCTPEHQKKNHKDYCNSLITYRKIVQYQSRNGLIKTYLPETYMEKEIKLESDINILLRKSKNEMGELEFLQLTEIATGPLTAAYSLQLFNENNSRTTKDILTIHIIGAETHFELSLLQKWEIFFLHYFPKIRIMNVIFIGPEINIERENGLKEAELCEVCNKRNRKINFKFFDKTLYHNYCKLRNYERPDLICAFNAGLYRETGFHEEDTWPETIKAMFKVRNIPVLVTAYTSVEISKDLKRIITIQKKYQIIQPASQNKYSSLKPNLNFVSYEDVPVIFKNYYLIVLQ